MLGLRRNSKFNSKKNEPFETINMQCYFNIKNLGFINYSVETTIYMKTNVSFEIFYMFKGQQVLTINGESYEQKTGDLTLIPNNKECTRKISKDSTVLGFTFVSDDTVLKNILAKKSILHYRCDGYMLETIKAYLDKIINQIHSNNTDETMYDFNIKLAVFKLISIICEDSPKNEELEYQSASQFKRHLAQLILNNIEKKFIEGNQNEIKSNIMSSISKEIGISVQYCSKIFNEVFSKSPRRYLTELKMSRAKKLLQDSNLTIENISTLLGYSITANFSRQFKKVTGTCPYDFKNFNRK